MRIVIKKVRWVQVKLLCWSDYQHISYPVRLLNDQAAV